MAEPNPLDNHAEECLRLEADRRELAKNIRSPALRQLLLQQAKAWSALAVSGPGAPSDDFETRTHTAPTKNALSTRTILIVEKHPLLQLMTASLMMAAGFNVILARNADQALSVLEGRPDVALLITNVVMQGSMDGVELASAVDIRWPSIKIMVVSGKRGLAESDLPEKCLLLAKPYHDDELVFEVRSLLGA